MAYFSVCIVFNPVMPLFIIMNTMPPHPGWHSIAHSEFSKLMTLSDG